MFAKIGVRLAFSLSASCLLIPVSGTAQIGVSSSGQASTSYPIAVPPGIAGMVPNLSLSFSDGGINGPVGVGWSIQGISVITRCPSTRATDGVPRGVEFNARDKLCLDGQRLIQTSDTGSPAAPQVDDALGLSTGAREFRTEKDSYARIRAYGTAGAAANGPARFKVWTKSGQIYEYGINSENGDANAVVNVQGTTFVGVWAVRRISDRLGNYIDFRYRQRDLAWGSGTVAGGAPGHKWNLEEVRYTGTTTLVPHNKVVFTYDERLATAAPGHDRSEAYQWNNKNISIERLIAIRTYVNAPGSGAVPVPVRTLKLVYTRSPVSGRSRLSSITECAGSSDTKCLPPTTYSYRDTSAVDFAANTAFASSPLNLLRMLDNTSGNFGVLAGDFNGDGRTDVLRWGSTMADNALYFSQGGGSFQPAGSFNLTNKNLFSNDGCYYSMVADFNGDGLSDILRVARSGCSAATALFISSGNGAFTEVTLPSSIDFTQATAVTNTYSTTCTQPQSASPERSTSDAAPPPSDNYGPPVTVAPAAQTGIKNSNAAVAAGTCLRYTRSLGKRFYVLDLNADGILDFVTTVAPDYSWNTGWGARPGEQRLCWEFYTGTCTRVFFGDGAGNYVEGPSTNSSLYSHPRSVTAAGNPYWRLPDQADFNGDGLQDILATYSGRWRSAGDGTFFSSPVQDGSQICGTPIDFNGDGRSDCLRPADVPSAQSLTLSYGAASSGPLAQFNLNTDPSSNLYGIDGSGRQNIGLIVEDFDGDGRQDILRWGPTASDHRMYLSNGDGSFRTQSPVGLQSQLTVPLQAADGSQSFVLGDFLGDGTVQILHLKSNPPATGGTTETTNQLYARIGATGPVDVLASVTSPAGLVTTVGPRLPLTQSTASGGRYDTDRGTAQAAQSPIVDLQPPMYVIASTTRDTGSGPLATQYLYKGLKADRGGRGMLGFREVHQQDTTPNGQTINVATEYLLQHPYNGVAWRTQTFLAALGQTGGQLLSSTVNTYCDRTSNTDPNLATPQSPCFTSAKVIRPYLRRSVETGYDLNLAALPTVTTTNSYNDFGDPVEIVVSTQAFVANGTRLYSKTTTNEFCSPGSILPGGTACPNRIDGDEWTLGRLTRASVTSSAPDLLDALVAGAGTSPTAAATTGVPPQGSSQPINAAALAAILQLLLDD